MCEGKKASGKILRISIYHVRFDFVRATFRNWIYWPGVLWTMNPVWMNVNPFRNVCVRASFIFFRSVSYLCRSSYKMCGENLRSVLFILNHLEMMKESTKNERNWTRKQKSFMMKLRCRFVNDYVCICMCTVYVIIFIILSVYRWIYFRYRCEYKWYRLWSGCIRFGSPRTTFRWVKLQCCYVKGNDHRNA